MKFSSLDEVKKHPQARLIPEFLLDHEEYYYENHYSIDDELLTLMTIATSDLSQHLEGSSSLHWAHFETQTFWLVCIGISHPDMSDDELLQLAHKHDVANSNIIKSLGILGKIKPLIELLTNNTSLKDDKILICDLICTTAIVGQYEVMNKLIVFAGDTATQVMQSKYVYEAFNSIVISGNVNALNTLVALFDNETVLMLIKSHPDYRAVVERHADTNSYYPFMLVAELGHTDMLDKLIELADNETIKKMIKANNYQAFRSAADNHYFDVLDKLIMLAPNEAQAMINTLDYHTHFRASRNENPAMAMMVLSLSPSIFGQAEMDGDEFSQVSIHAFFTQKLATLKQQKAALEAVNLNAIFNLTDANEIKHCFYIARYLIRQNVPSLLDALHFFLDIPAVKAIAHSNMQDGEENQLLRLALSIGNQDAAGLLLNIDAVRELAERNNFYREPLGQLDLRQLARDRESSMHALSTAEQKNLAEAIAYYQPTLDSLSVPKIMQALRETLKERFKENPARITLLNGKEQILPIDHSSYLQLNLNGENRENALKAYYQHPDHSALRYLSKPNHWMSTEASYVNVNPNNQTERWSTFEEYQPLIAMLWLAVNDKEKGTTAGHTLTCRLDHFISELALIGRAHNWDNTRARMRDGQKVEEEYDDLKGDKPSCFSGVKRRLFQSVIGHPLIQLFTKDDLLTELRDFVLEHFKSILTEKNLPEIKKAWEDYIVEMTFDPKSPLALLNIPEEKQTLFIDHLTKVYGIKFTDKPSYQAEIRRRFMLDNTKECHAITLDGLVGFNQFIEKFTIEPKKDNVGNQGMFSRTTERGNNETDENDIKPTPQK